MCAPYRAVVDCHNIIASHCPLLVSLTFAGDYGSNGAGDAEADAVLRCTDDDSAHDGYDNDDDDDQSPGS